MSVLFSAAVRNDRRASLLMQACTVFAALWAEVKSELASCPHDKPQARPKLPDGSRWCSL